MTKLVLVLAYPRSGSSMLAHCLGESKTVTTIQEPFHQNIDVVRSHVRSGLGEAKSKWLNDYTNEQLDKLIHGDHRSFLNKLLSNCNTEYLVIKLFPGHLNRQGMKDLFAVAAAGIILQRNPVSSYISNEIAKISGVYSGRNTSSETVDFEPNRFVGWYNYAFKFIEQARELVNETGLPICNTHYETLLSQTDLFGYLKVIFERQAISLHFSDERKMRTKQQDTRRTASEKLTNPESLLTFLEKVQLAHLSSGLIFHNKVSSISNSLTE